MFDRFLVPLDGSHMAEKAATTAAELAHQCSAELVFLRVCPSDDAVKDAVDYLEQICDKYRRDHLQVRGEAYWGDPTSKIVEVSEKEDIDLIVMSSHGRTGMARTVFGSVAESVMRASVCPVMVVRAHPVTPALLRLAVSPA